MKSRADWVARTSVICGAAPIPLFLLSMLPSLGWLSGASLLFGVPCAIAIGIVGLVRARSQPEPNYLLPLSGLLLGVTWVVLTVAVMIFIAH